MKAPPTIVAIIMDNGERIELDSMRGISGTAGTLLGTPHSVRLKILENYIFKLAREWEFHELGFNPDDAIPTQDALQQINVENQLARFGGKDSRNNQLALATMTEERVVAAAKMYEKTLPKHRIATTVASDLRISPQWVRTILRKHRKTKVR